MSEMQNEMVALTKRPMIVKHVHESGPYAWYASKFMSDGFQYAAPGATKEEAVENLATFLMETLERYEDALCDIAAMNPGMAEACAADDAWTALGSHFKNGERVGSEGSAP